MSIDWSKSYIFAANIYPFNYDHRGFEPDSNHEGHAAPLGRFVMTLKSLKSLTCKDSSPGRAATTH